MRFKVVAYYPLQFAELRKRVVVGGDLAFVLSLSRCKRWHPRGGKTMAYFAKTHDERFVIKQLSRPEKVCRAAPHTHPATLLQSVGWERARRLCSATLHAEPRVQASFLEFAPHYFAHCAECSANATESCLSRVLGLYHVQNRTESWSLDIVVTENVFYEKELAKTFDLKGTLRTMGDRDRKGGGAAAGERGGVASAADAKSGTLLDDQLRRSIMTRPLTVAPDERHKLMRALKADTAFLARVGVMDYSLLLGVDRTNVRLPSLPPRSAVLVSSAEPSAVPSCPQPSLAVELFSVRGCLTRAQEMCSTALSLASLTTFGSTRGTSTSRRG